MQTHFAPPERLSREEIAAMSQRLKGETLLAWFDAVPVSVLIINQHRQIIYCNEAFRKLTRRSNREDIIGLRPGEALDCVYAGLEKAGCGCSKFCSVCGAAQAILRSLRGEQDCQICRLLRLLEDAESALDLEVFTQSIDFNGAKYVFFTALDISHEKRLRYLERTFHHSLVDIAGGMAGLADFTDMQNLDKETAQAFGDCSRRLLREVLYHRDVAEAEQGVLDEIPQAVPLSPFLDRLIQECAGQNLPTMPTVRQDIRCASVTAAKRILGHVLRNMLKNALEACSKASDEVLLSCEEKDGRVRITITNPGEMPLDIQKQLFKRYVSTKGADRGLGTYVMRLFTRQHLGGEVEFTSSNGSTTFTLLL